MLNENSLLKYLWVETVHTACYVLNHMLIRPYLNKTPYELWKYKKPNIGYFKIFGCKCFILNVKDNLGKFDLNSYIDVFLSYSNTSKTYRVHLYLCMLYLMSLILLLRRKLFSIMI